MWRLGVKITEVGMPDQFFGTRLLQVVFLSVALFMPLLSMLTLLFLWLAPLPRRIARGVLFACEVMHAWSALDVFGVSLLVALFEIRQFAKFIIGDRCDLINRLLDQYAKELFVDGPATCFDVHTKLLRGCWILVGSFAAYFLVSALVMHLCNAALEPDEIGASKAEVAESDSEQSSSEQGRMRSYGSINRFSHKTRLRKPSVFTRIACWLRLMRLVVTSNRE